MPNGSVSIKPPVVQVAKQQWEARLQLEKRSVLSQNPCNQFYVALKPFNCYDQWASSSRETSSAAEKCFSPLLRDAIGMDSTRAGVRSS
mmetsp:Transcript_34957/g.47529  ORF Transcript_34957/g.47529 Transcript_34957/m.47529 type:complete len:89 (-) Transcript_34957:454-720(-)